MSLVELKEELKKNKAVLGADQVMKLLVNNGLKKVYLSSNCFDKEKILNLAKMNNVEVITLQETRKQIGTACKKNFEVSALGFK